MGPILGFDAYSPREIAERVESACMAKSATPVLSLVMLGVLAGAFIGLGSLFYVIVASDPTLGFAASRVLGALYFRSACCWWWWPERSSLRATTCSPWRGRTAA